MRSSCSLVSAPSGIVRRWQKNRKKSNKWKIRSLNPLAWSFNNVGEKPRKTACSASCIYFARPKRKVEFTPPLKFRLPGEGPFNGINTAGLSFAIKCSNNNSKKPRLKFRYGGFDQFDQLHQQINFQSICVVGRMPRKASTFGSSVPSRSNRPRRAA